MNTNASKEMLEARVQRHDLGLLFFRISFPKSDQNGAWERTKNMLQKVFQMTSYEIAKNTRNDLQGRGKLWGNSASHVRYKHVTVVDQDIDIHDYAAIDWAFAWRFNAGEDDLIVYPSNWGAGLDPSVRARDCLLYTSPSPRD